MSRTDSPPVRDTGMCKEELIMTGLPRVRRVYSRNTRSIRIVATRDDVLYVVRCVGEKEGLPVSLTDIDLGVGRTYGVNARDMPCSRDRFRQLITDMHEAGDLVCEPGSVWREQYARRGYEHNLKAVSLYYALPEHAAAWQGEDTANRLARAERQAAEKAKLALASLYPDKYVELYDGFYKELTKEVR